MDTLTISQFSAFTTPKAIHALNMLLTLHTHLMAHQVAVATGCTVDEAMGLLLYLAALTRAEPRTLVYHRTHLDDPPAAILALPLNEGPPALPFICPECNEEVETYDELLFDIIFIIQSTFRFQE